MTFQPGDRVEYEGRPGSVIQRVGANSVFQPDGETRTQFTVEDELLTTTGRNVVRELTLVASGGGVSLLRMISAPGNWHCFEHWCGRELHKRVSGSATKALTAFNEAEKANR